MSGTDMFYVNDVLLDLKDNTRYRILWKIGCLSL